MSGVLKLPESKRSGRWVPAVTAVTNLDSAPVLVQAFFGVTGRLVQCFVEFTYDPTAAGDFAFRISLPFGRDFPATANLIGRAATQDQPLGFRVKGEMTAGQTIADGGALVDLDFTAADLFDIGAWHDPAVDPELFTTPAGAGGAYLITAGIEWAEAITNIRDITAQLQVGGVLIEGGLASARLEVGEDHASTIHVVAVLAAADAVKLQVSQDDTVGALGLDVLNATLSIAKVSGGGGQDGSVAATLATNQALISSHSEAGVVGVCQASFGYLIT